jgi:hypothetical protein
MENITKVTVWDKTKSQIKSMKFFEGDLFSGLGKSKREEFKKKRAYDDSDKVDVCVLPFVMFEEASINNAGELSLPTDMDYREVQ